MTSLAALKAKLEGMTGQLSNLTHWLKGTPFSIGLDVGSYSLKAVLLKQVGSELQWVQAVEQPLANSPKSQQHSEAVQQLLGTLDCPEAKLVTAVGGAGTILRPVLMPKMTPQELKTSLSFEAEKHIPFKLEEVFLDSSVLGERPGGRMEVLLAAARKDKVNEHLNLLTQAQALPSVVDLEPLALANAWEHYPAIEDSQVVVQIHVGARGTIFNFLKENQLQFSREASIGGAAFTQAIVEGLGLPFEKSEQVKCQPSDQTEAVRSVLEPVWEQWGHQCHASFDFYENQFGLKPEVLVLSG